MTTTTYILFTNIKNIVVNGVNTTTSALLLGERCANDYWVRHATAFGVDATLVVFDMLIDTIEHELVVRRPDDHNGDDAVQLVDGPRFTVIKEAWDQPINSTRITFDEKDDAARDHTSRRIRRLIARGAAHYWRAPNMPGVIWGPREKMAEFNLKMAER